MFPFQVGKQLVLWDETLRLTALARLYVTEPRCTLLSVFLGAVTLSGMCKAQTVTLTA